MDINKLWGSVRILALLGIGLAGYLLWQQNFRSEFQPCYVNSLMNCESVISGPVAKTWGIPTPIYGLIGYVLIWIFGFIKKAKWLLAVATFGLVFCGWIGYRELFELRVICPVCIGCQVIMVAIFGLAVWIKRLR